MSGIISIVVPLAFVFIVALFRKLPYIGGKMAIGLFIGALLCLILGGVPAEDWFMSLFNGINTFSWCLILCPLGSIFAQTQIKIGSIGGVMRVLQSIFGKSLRGLIACTFISLIVAGSLIGVSGESAAVVGILVISTLHAFKLSPEKITSIITMGATLGSIMPPVSSALFQTSAIVGVDLVSVQNQGFFFIGACAIFALLYIMFGLVTKEEINSYIITEKEDLGKAFKAVAPKLIPIVFFAVLVLLNNGYGINVPNILFGPVIDLLAKIPLLNGFTTSMAVMLTTVIVFSIFVYKDVRTNVKPIIKEGVFAIKDAWFVLVGIGCFTGSLKAGGQLVYMEELALSGGFWTMMIVGGIAILVLGMLSGSDSLPLGTIFPFMSSPLIAYGIAPASVAIGAGIFGCAGQGLPPADMTTFIVASFVVGILGKKVNIMKAMMYNVPLNIFMIVTGLAVLFVFG